MPAETTTISILDEITVPVDDDQLYLEGASGAHYGRIELETLIDYFQSNIKAGAFNTGASSSVSVNLFLSHANSYFDLYNSSNPQTVNLPTNASVAFPVGTWFLFNRRYEYPITFASSDTIIGPTTLNGEGDAMLVVRDSTATWRTMLLAHDPITQSGSGEISALTEKTTVVGADHLLIEDSEASDAKKRVTVSTALKSKPEQISIACTAFGVDVEDSTTYARWVPRYDVTLLSVAGSLDTAPTGQAMIVDIHAGGTTVMSTNKISIDAGDTDSSDARTQPALTTTDIAAGTEVLIIVDQVGSGTAGAGLVVDIVYNQN